MFLRRPIASVALVSPYGFWAVHAVWGVSRSIGPVGKEDIILLVGWTFDPSRASSRQIRRLRLSILF